MTAGENDVATEITVIIADDHPVFRQGLRQIIETDKQLQIVGEAADGQTAIAQILETKADVAVLDVDMPNSDGFEVVRAVRQKQSAVSIVFLTMHKDERFLNAALDIGVKGYLLKDSAVTDIIASIKAVAAGRDYVSPALTSFLVNRSRRSAELARRVPPARPRQLLPRADPRTGRSHSGRCSGPLVLGHSTQRMTGVVRKTPP